MLCSHWTATDRAYGMIDDLERSRASGELSAATIETASARIDALLAAAPQHAPRLLPPELLAAHAGLAPLQHAPGAVGQTVSLEET
jgi:hypothetical protein